MIRILLIDDQPDFLETLKKLLSLEPDFQVVGTALDGEAGIDLALRQKPDVILADINMPKMDGIEVTEALRIQLPACPVIIMSVQGEREYLDKSLIAGAKAFIVKPFSDEDLVKKIRSVHENQLAYARKFAESIGYLIPGSAAKHEGRVIAVVSGKGGVGRSLLASNLALALPKETTGNVILVDLSLQFGDVGIIFNKHAQRTLSDLAGSQIFDLENPGSFDEEALRAYLVQVKDGVSLLLSPKSPELAELVTAEQITPILSALRRLFDYVIVDTPRELNEVTIAALEVASEIIVLTDRTIPSIKNTKLLLKLLSELKIDSARILTILALLDGRPLEQKLVIEKTIGQPITLCLPYDPTPIYKSYDEGAPVLALYPDAPISKAYEELAKCLLPETLLAEKTGQKSKKRNFFGLKASKN